MSATAALTVRHPAHLTKAIGAETDVVYPIHEPTPVGHRKCNLVHVYEPRRGCDYYVYATDLAPAGKARQ